MICFSCKQASPATFIITHFLQGGETTMHRIKKNISKIPELIMNRVYIHLDDSYNIISDSNLTPLINAVAKQHPIAYGVTLSESNSDCTIFYPKRTLHFILHEIDDFIYGINQRKADETMATFTSLKQIRRVNYLLIGKEKSVPAYTVIILYTIFKLLPADSPDRDLCKKILECIHAPIHLYFLQNPKDELARFFEDCFVLVINAMTNGNEHLSITDFPGIPREHPRETIL